MQAQIFKIVTSGADRFVRAFDESHAMRIAVRAFKTDDRMVDYKGERIGERDQNIMAASLSHAVPMGRHALASVGTHAYDSAVESHEPGAREANRAARTSARAARATPQDRERADNAVAELLALLA